MESNRNSRRIAGVELGGTKCVLTLGSRPDDIVAKARIDTTTPEKTMAAIIAKLDDWRDRHGFDAIGIASFGPLDLTPASPDFGKIVATTKPHWSGAPVHGPLNDRYGLPTAIETDVNGAALAEGRWGAAEGLGTHAYITIGTGVGVGLLVNGLPVQGFAHGEAGHMRIPRATDDGFAGACSYHGDCIEGLIAGPALARRFGAPGPEIARDDPRWAHVAHDIAAMLHNLVVTLAPERIAIGGGVFAARPELFAPVRAKLAESLNGYGLFAKYADELENRIGPPGLGDMAGPLGAIAVGLTARN